jgi:hypothetical protein
MIIIGGGFSDKNMKYIVERVSRQERSFDIIKFGQYITEVFSQLGSRKKEILKVKNRVLTPDQEIEAENFHRRVHDILNRPPAIRKLY